MKVAPGARIFVFTGRFAGYFGEIDYYDTDEAMFLVQLEDETQPRAVHGSEFRLVEFEPKRLNAFLEVVNND